MAIDTPICDFGLHQGEKYTDLPASFLNWMVEIEHEKCDFAKQELQRRESAVLKSCSKRN
jgi:uncharacterized protein (DUF3820 family)